MKATPATSMEKPQLGPAWLSSPLVFGLGLSLIFAAIVLIARANAFSFPLANEDDARFFFPPGAWLFMARCARPSSTRLMESSGCHTAFTSGLLFFCVSSDPQ